MATMYGGEISSYSDNCKYGRIYVKRTTAYLRILESRIKDTETKGTSTTIIDYGTCDGGNILPVFNEFCEFMRKETNGKKIEFIFNDQDAHSLSLLFHKMKDYPNFEAKDDVTITTQIGDCRKQCLPDQSVAIVFCNLVLQWLSTPCVIKNDIFWIGYQKEELKAIKQQAENDWKQFLEIRAAELKPGGVLITVFHGEGHNTREFLVAASNVFRTLYLENHISQAEYEETVVNFYLERSEADIRRPFTNGEIKDLTLLEVNCQTFYFKDLGLTCETVTDNFKAWMLSCIQNGMSTDRTEEHKNKICDLYFDRLHTAFLSLRDVFDLQSFNLYETIMFRQL